MVKQSLEGVKVADFCWVGVGPIMAKYLADHGATVIHIESAARPDTLRVTAPFKDNIAGVNRAPYHASFNNNKYGVTLNLNHPRAKEIVERIIKWADIVGESFTPGTTEKWGLNYEDVKRIKPDIIMYSAANLGQTGPYSRQRGFGTHLVALSGFTYLTGWADRVPTPPYGAYTDVIAPRFGVAALVAALDYHRKTGEGQYLDLAQYEAGIQFLTPAILDYQASGRVAGRMGNACPYAAPYGIYPCKGNDCWCAIAVFTSQEWRAFCQVMRNPEWTKDARFTSLLARKQNEDELDRLVGKWTIGFTAEEVMITLQKTGVAAGAVRTTAEIQEDPQLKHRHHYWALEHPEIGWHHYDSPSFKLSKTPCELKMPGPCLGQHNEYVYTKILGLPDGEFIELLTEGVFD